MADESGVQTIKPKWYTINRSLLPVKGFYFFVLAAVGDLLPYIPLYMKELNLSSSETGVIYGIMPFVGFLVRPLIGAIADRTRKHKLVLALCCVFTGIFYLLILIIPSKNTSNQKLEYTTLETKIHCNEFDSYIRDCYKNDTSLKEKCPLSFERYVEILKNSRLKDIGNNSASSIDNISLKSSVNNHSTYTVIDSEIGINSSCVVKCQYKTTGEISQNTTKACFTDRLEQTEKQCFDVVVTLTKEPDLIFTIPNISDITKREVNTDRQEIGSMVCRDYDLKGLLFKNQPYWQMLCNENTEMICQLQCSPVKDDRCPPSTPLTEHNMTETFWLFLVIYLFANIAFTPVISLGDAMAYDILGEKRNRWGMQRLWGTIGFALFAITSTFVMDMITKETEQINFSVSFYIFGVMFLISAFVSYMMPISEDLVCSQMLKNLSKLLRNLEIMVFLIVIMIFGIYTGAIETFLFWYLQDLGDWSQIIAGLALLVSCSAELPLLLVSGKIIKHIGQIPCLYLVFGGYAIRFIAYSFLTNPWVVLPIELLHGITFGVMYAAATSYASIIAPPGMSATIQGLIGGIHFGFGKGIGSLVTGVLYDESVLGSRWTFRLYGILSLIFLICYAVINRFYFKQNKKGDNRNKRPDDDDSPPESKDRLLDNTNKDQSEKRNMEEIELDDS